MNDVQGIIDRVIALLGSPVERVIWIPPIGAVDDPRGRFVVVYRNKCREATDD